MTASIGVFDSGIGGLSVLRELLRLMPDESYIYLGDSARVPYGTKSAETVRLFAGQCAQFLLDQGVQLIVVACNTASAVALETIRAAVDIPVVGMIEPAAQAALRSTRSGQIGVIGTRGTVTSGAYPAAIHALNRHNPAPAVHSFACPLFVPLVEEGWTDHPATRLVAQDYLEHLFAHSSAAGSPDIDTLVLGCTHYPLLKPLLHELLPSVHLIDCGEHAAHVARDILGYRASPSTNATPNVRFYLTDIPPAFVSIADRFLGFAVGSVERADIDHLVLADKITR
ncbi:MAG: glutamate racemase [Caldilineaceae bacterium]